MNSSQSKIIERLVKLYQSLLVLYPKAHREEYGWLMIQLFRDKAYDAYQYQGFMGITIYCLHTLIDLLASVIRERQERDVTFSDAAVVGSHPILLMAGGILLAFASISQLQPDDHYSFYGIYAVSMLGLPVAIVTLVVGLYGMRHWIDRKTTIIGQLGIRIGLLGGMFAPVLMFFLPLAEIIWGIMMLGLIMLFLGYVLIGIDLWMNKTLPMRIGAGMIVAGITPFIAFSMETTRIGPRYVDFAGMLLTGLCLVIVGNTIRQRAKRNPIPQ